MNRPTLAWKPRLEPVTLTEGDGVEIQGTVYQPPFQARLHKVAADHQTTTYEVCVQDQAGVELETFQHEIQDGATRLGQLAEEPEQKLREQVQQQLDKLHDHIQQLQSLEEENENTDIDQPPNPDTGSPSEEYLRDDFNHLRDQRTATASGWPESSSSQPNPFTIAITLVVLIGLFVILWATRSSAEAARKASKEAVSAKLIDALNKFPPLQRNHYAQTGQILDPPSQANLPTKAQIRYSPHYHQGQLPTRDQYVLEALDKESFTWCVYNHTPTKLSPGQTLLQEGVGAGQIRCQ